MGDLTFSGLLSAPGGSRETGDAPAAEADSSTHHVSRTVGAQRIVAFGRLILAVYSLFALAVDPPPLRFARLTYFLLYSYTSYAIWRAIAVWTVHYTSRRWQIVRHILDLVVFSALTLLTQGANSPFFLGFIFSVVCAALLFDTAGTAYTAAGAVVAYVLIVSVGRQLVPTAEFTLHRFLLRTAFLAVITVLVLELKIHEARVLSDTGKLAEWPRRVPVNLRAMIGEMLQHAAELLHARVIIVWQDADNPLMRIARRSGGDLIISEEPFSTFNPLVEPATPRSFVSGTMLRLPRGRSAWAASFRPLQSNPIDAGFRRRFDVEQVVGCRFDGDYASGWLFALDKTDVTSDDLLLADIVAGLVESRFEQFYLSERLRQNALLEERVRFARDLHDGILQSLSGTAMHLQRLRHLIEHDPDAALLSLQKVEEAIIADQTEVRSHVMRLRSAVLIDEHPLLSSRLQALAERVQSERGMAVNMDISPLVEMISPGMAEETYRVVREAVMNAAAHAKPSRISVQLTVGEDRVLIVVEDDGHGFAFTGRYDLHALTQLRRGPVTLKERVWALMGNLVIDSKPTGARLEIDLPTSLVRVPV